METDYEIEPVEIYCGDIMQAEMLRSLLENAEINAFLKDEMMGTLTAPGGACAVKVLVSNGHPVEYGQELFLIDTSDVK